jgi:hypothetical protein
MIIKEDLIENTGNTFIRIYNATEKVKVIDIYWWTETSVVKSILKELRETYSDSVFEVYQITQSETVSIRNW